MQVSEARVASLVAGNNLRASRERLGLTMRDVESASMRLAARHGNDEFVINPSRLSDIETKGLVPSVYRLYTLAIVYRLERSCKLTNLRTRFYRACGARKLSVLFISWKHARGIPAHGAC